MSIDTLVSTAKARGLSGVAICDHNVFTPHKSRDDFFIIPGCEFSTDIGHLLVLFMKEPVNKALARDDHGRFFWRDICKAAHEQSALVFLAHPYAPAIKRPDALFKQLDGIELFNSRVVHSRITNANERAADLTRKLNLPYCAGSDAHCPEEVGTSFWECDIPDAELASPAFEEKLKSALMSRVGRVYGGATDVFTVLRCKREVYIKRKLYSRLLKNILLCIRAKFKKDSKKAFHGGYIQ